MYLPLGTLHSLQYSLLLHTSNEEKCTVVKGSRKKCTSACVFQLETRKTSEMVMAFETDHSTNQPM